jgi:hypothetical protein
VNTAALACSLARPLSIRRLFLFRIHPQLAQPVAVYSIFIQSRDVAIFCRSIFLLNRR